MSAPPYMKFFWGDYHKATRHLTRDQHGAYFLLIGEAWRLGGSLPDDDALLAAWSRCTPSEWSKIKPIILAFFTYRRGKWAHDRVREELATYAAISRKRKEAGKRGGSASDGNHRGNRQANAKQLPTKPEPQSERVSLSPSQGRETYSLAPDDDFALGEQSSSGAETTIVQFPTPAFDGKAAMAGLLEQLAAKGRPA